MTKELLEERAELTKTIIKMKSESDELKGLLSNAHGTIEELEATVEECADDQEDLLAELIECRTELRLTQETRDTLADKKRQLNEALACVRRQMGVLHLRIGDLKHRNSALAAERCTCNINKTARWCTPDEVDERKELHRRMELGPSAQLDWAEGIGASTKVVDLPGPDLSGEEFELTNEELRAWHERNEGEGKCTSQ